MKNYNINFNYLLAPVILATGYIGSNYFSSKIEEKRHINDEKEEDNSIPFNKIKKILVKQFNKINNTNQEHFHQIIKNRQLLCKLSKSILINTETIYIETLLINDKLHNLLEIFNQNINCIQWFEDEDELIKIYQTIERSENKTIKNILEELNYKLNDIANKNHKDEFLSYINFIEENFKIYINKMSTTFDNIQNLIDNNLVQDKIILNDLIFINKYIKSSIENYYKDITIEFEKLKEIIDLIEWLDLEMLEKIC